MRIDDGALLDAAEQIDRARAQLTPSAGRGSSPRDPRLRARRSSTRELDALAARAARRRRCKLRVDGALRERAARRPLRLRARARRGLRRRHLGHRPRVHARRVREQLDRQRRTRRAASRATSPAPASTTPSCAPPRERTARARAARAPARPRRPRQQPRPRPRPARRADRPHRRPAAGAQGDRLPPARPPPPRADRLRRRLEPTANASSPSATPAATSRARPTRSLDAELQRALEDPDPLRGDRRSWSPAGPPRSCSTPTGCPRTKRSAPSGWRASCATRCRRRAPAARRRLGVPAPDALPAARRAAPRRVRRRRADRAARSTWTGAAARRISTPSTSATSSLLEPRDTGEAAPGAVSPFSPQHVRRYSLPGSQRLSGTQHAISEPLNHEVTRLGLPARPRDPREPSTDDLLNRHRAAPATRRRLVREP